MDTDAEDTDGEFDADRDTADVTRGAASQRQAVPLPAAGFDDAHDLDEFLLMSCDDAAADVIVAAVEPLPAAPEAEADADDMASDDDDDDDDDDARKRRCRKGNKAAAAAARRAACRLRDELAARETAARIAASSDEPRTGGTMRFDTAGEEHAALVRLVAETPRRKPDRRSPNGICWAEINRKVMAGEGGPLLQRRVLNVQSKVLSKRWFQFGPREDYPNRDRIVR